MKAAKWMGVAVVAGLAGASAPAARADEGCGCTQRPEHAASALSGYGSAFAGRVDSVVVGSEATRATFRVFRAWKGSRDRTLVVTTPLACGVTFEPGRDYLVYAKKDGAALRTDACSPTGDLTRLSNAVRQLDLHTGLGVSPMRVPPADDRTAAKR